MSERLGLVPRGDGTCAATVWAPAAEREVAIRTTGAVHPLEETAAGFWSGEVPLAHGDRYVVLRDGEAWPDPCSRRQPAGVRGASAVVDPSAFACTDEEWDGIRLEEAVLYELHVSTFDEHGTFDGVIAHLQELRELGVTAIELMPVATFPGERNWGYDGLYTWAPHESYGGPAGLARLVDSAHRAGLGVVLDVVYNHLGPGNEALRAFGPYATEHAGTPWGDTLDFTQRGVREWAIQNAEMWVRDYHVDGLRLDAVHAIHDPSDEHVLAELAHRVRRVAPRALVISETGVEDFRPLDDWSHDAVWVDSLHHQLHVALTGERDGYYAPFDGSMSSIAAELRRPRGPALVVSAQNHDQVGNRPLGDRLPPRAGLVAAAAVLFSPFTPLLFQGEEGPEVRPFRYFTDHIDPAIAEATVAGRRREFAAFPGFDADECPDPQAEATFRASRLDRSAWQEERRAFIRGLLELRRRLPRQLEIDADDERRTLTLTRGGSRLSLDFGAQAVSLEQC